MVGEGKGREGEGKIARQGRKEKEREGQGKRARKEGIKIKGGKMKEGTEIKGGKMKEGKRQGDKYVKGERRRKKEKGQMEK